jgi:uncharacterized membrane protein
MLSFIMNKLFRLNGLIQGLAIPKGWLRVVLVLLLILSVFFRFVQLDEKVYSADEVRSFLRISGYTSEEFVARFYDGNVVTVASLQEYQRPTAERNLGDAIAALSGNPEHPPLYYLLARFWTQWFDNPVGARVLAVLMSLLVFPALYWLCLELFKSQFTAWIAIALFASSPYHLLLAQPARQYSLWAVTILLSSALLLRSLRLQTKPLWGLYGVSVALGLYTHLFFGFVAISHGLYVLIMEGFKLSKNLVSYVIASCLGLVMFSPWIWVIITNLDNLERKTKWAKNYQTELKNLVRIWLDNLSRIFIDFPYEASLKNPIPYLILMLVGYGIYFLVRRTPLRIWLFILTLIGVTALSQVLPDLIWGGRRSLLPRYLLPSYVGIQLTIAYLIATQMTAISGRMRRWKLGNLIFASLIVAGVLSSTLISESKSWEQTASSINLEIAPIINKSSHPLVISDASHTFIIPLTYLLNSQVKMQLFEESALQQSEVRLNLPDDSKEEEVFLYFPSPKMLDTIQNQNVNLEVMTGAFLKYGRDKNWLYKLEVQN